MKAGIGVVLFIMAVVAVVSCKKSNDDVNNRNIYFEVGFKDTFPDWRDTSFIIATSNVQLIQQAEAQLALPVSARKIVLGNLLPGDGGYNRNGSHLFKWHFNEDDWRLVDATVEIYDGRPYSDVDADTAYWLTNMKRYGSWSSYVKRKLPANP